MAHLSRSQLIRLACPVQHSSWGKRSPDGLVARLSRETQNGIPCAELWMGAHPSAPSLAEGLGENPISLDNLITTSPDSNLGAACLSKFGPRLPFLFKVLSIESPLSIQSHPDLALAERLHRKAPEVYPDSNHKPELMVALSAVRLLYGFRPVPEIARALDEVPELFTLLGDSAPGLRGGYVGALPFAYRRLFNASPQLLHDCCTRLYARLAQKNSRSPEEDWILKIAPLFPDGDVGIFSFFFCNLVSLEPGQGLFVGPRTVHSYLDGELVECMANSDNVIRAGLTEKYKDVETLLDMLTYKTGGPAIIHPTLEPDGWQGYSTPAAEFSLSVADQPGVLRLHAWGKPGIFLSLSGRGQWDGSPGVPIEPGDIYFVPAVTEPLTFSLHSGTVFFARVP